MYTERKISIHKENGQVSKPVIEATAIGYLNCEPQVHKMTRKDGDIDACENLNIFIRLPEKMTHPILAYGREAFLLGQYGTKGSKIFLRGFVMNGNIIVKNIEFLETKEQTEERRAKNKLKAQEEKKENK